MKTQIVLHVVSLIIIAVLGSCVGYLSFEKRRILKSANQFIIASSVHTYQSLDHGDIDALKQTTGAFVTFQSSEYERLYGHETGTKFASVLEDAKVIRDKSSSK
jgi:hypothetical protein